MTEWAVVGVIITLCGFIFTVCKPLISLTKAITELTIAVKNLQTDSKEQKKDAKESHRLLWEHNNKQDKQIEANKDKIAEHEKEIKAITGRV